VRLLVLGGTIFLGRHLVAAARARGHEVTLLHRGVHGAELFPDVERILADREAGLGAVHALRGRAWDAVIDTCGYVPRVVGASAEALAGAVGHYTFVSSLSVYADTSRAGIAEDAAVATLEDETIEAVTGETYGALKALCERAAERAMPGRVLVVRPGLIVGPHDPTDRFTYWPARFARGDAALVPGRPQRRIGFVDARDLADWMLAAVEDGVTGVFNVNGPDGVLTMGELVDACRDACRTARRGAGAPRGAEPVWVDEAFLLERGVAPWSDLPLWIPESAAESAGFFAFDVARALARGLTFRPLATTVRDTLGWHATRPTDHAWRAGMTPAREAELLAAWRTRSSGASRPPSRSP